MYVACTNAVYLRSNLCEWGYLGKEFQRDMKIVEKVTRMEMEMYREITTYNIHHQKKKMRRDNGIGNPKHLEGIFHWKRSTQVSICT